MKPPIRQVHSDSVVEGVLQKVITVAEVTKNEVASVDKGLAETNKRIDSLTTRVSLGFIVMGLLLAFVIVLQFLTLTKRVDVHVLPVTAEQK